MHHGHRSSCASGPAIFEPLESRQLQSVSTTTTITASPTRSVEFGQTVDIAVKVKAVKGKLSPRGNVRLYLNKQAAIWNATLNSKGIAHIVIDPGLTIYPGTYSLTVRYTSSNKFTTSTSKKAALTVTSPAHLITKSDGLGVETITPGSGAAVVAGNSITVKETGYDTTGAVVGQTLTQKPSSFTFTVNANPEQVLAGFDEGVLGMKPGEVRVLDIPSALNTSSHVHVLFVVQLLSINK